MRRKEENRGEQGIKKDWHVLYIVVRHETYSYVLSVVRTTRWIWCDKVELLINFTFKNMDMHFSEDQDEDQDEQ